MHRQVVPAESVKERQKLGAACVEAGSQSLPGLAACSGAHDGMYPPMRPAAGATCCQPCHASHSFRVL